VDGALSCGFSTVKNQYFGDVSDYRKYGLLRLLTDGGLTLGVNWMLTPNDDGTDGNKREYLSDPAKWRGCDEALYDGLTALLDGGQPPGVSLLEGSDLLPDTTFFSELVPDGKEERLAWASQARGTLSDCDLVFLDPDNGLEIKSKKIGAKNSSKFALWDEVRAYWEQGSSLLIYQHWIRMERSAFFNQQATCLKELLGVDQVIGISTAHVLFLLVPQAEHVEQLEVGLTLLPLGWESQIKLIDSEGVQPPDQELEPGRLPERVIDDLSYPLITEFDPAGVYDLLENHRGEFAPENVYVQYHLLKHLTDGLTVCVDTVAEGVWGDPETVSAPPGTARYFWMTKEQHTIWVEQMGGG
jgi:hypothetical protein